MKSNNSILLKVFKNYIGIILILFTLVIGLFTIKNYGVSWDEPEQRKIGLINYDYIFDDDGYLLEWFNRDYGVAFELPLVIIEKTLNLSDFRSIFIMRHIFTHVFFLFSLYLFYKLIINLYENKLLGVIGILLLLLHPRIYGHSFFNSKDIPFLSLIIISLYFFSRIIQKRTILNGIFTGIFTGLLINVRIMGIYIPTFIGLYLLIDAIGEKKYKENIQIGLIIISSMLLTLYASWPFLWTNPLDNFIYAFYNMSKFRWFGELLFMGEFIKGYNIPSTYFPIWFSLTTPISYLVFGLVGFLLIIFKIFKSPLIFLKDKTERFNLMIFGCFITPILSVIVLNSVLYDGWRHLFFTYPFFILITIYGLNILLRSKAKFLIIILLTSTFLYIGWFYLNNIPNQHVYFNKIHTLISDKNIEDEFDMDYWGLSYKQAFEYLGQVDNSKTIKVSCNNTPGQYNLDMLPLDLRNRFENVTIQEAKYFITNFRGRNSLIDSIDNHLIKTILVQNNPVCKIYKIDKNE